jgi:phosphoglycolate phosphatase
MTGAVLFDLDGTLVDTPGGMTRVLRAVVESAGMPVNDAVLHQTVGRPLVTSLAVLLDLPADHPEVTGAADQVRALFTEIVIPKASDLVFPGTWTLLALLRQRGCRLAVVTSKVERSAVELLEATGLIGEFDALACHDMAGRGKPAPDLALLAARELDVAPQWCAVVGDAMDDMRMAVAAGMDAIGLTCGVASNDDLVAAGARRVYTGPAGLCTALTSDPSASRLTLPGLVSKVTR